MFALLTHMDSFVFIIGIRVILSVLYNLVSDHICVSQSDTLRDDRHKVPDNSQPAYNYAGCIEAHKEQTFNHVRCLQ